MSSRKTTIDENFPKRLKLLIEDKLKLTQGEFARNIGVTAGYLSMVVTGKRGPSAEMMAGLYVNYSQYLTWLLTGKHAEKLNKKSDTRKFEILDQAEEWLTEQVEKDPEREIWFKVEFKKAFQEFKEWKEEKEESEAREDNTPTRKVA